jgi:protein-S-isoprenylcysteine O-methyltransferase Ste14
MKPLLAFKSILFALLLSGTVAVFFPFLVLTHSGVNVLRPSVSVSSFFAIIVGLAPIDAPKVLVVRGAYEYTRNPMYLAVLSILISETILFQNGHMLTYTAIVFICFYLFVRFYEEPGLRKRFGVAYQDYCRVVPRWWFTLHPYGTCDRAGR